MQANINGQSNITVPKCPRISPSIALRQLLQPIALQHIRSSYYNHSYSPTN